jgi:carboxypeptidase Taq
MTAAAAYAELVRRSRERTILGSCAAVLSWDEQTFLPAGGAELRSNQLGLLAGLVHERATDPIVGDLLSAVEASSSMDGEDGATAVNVREWRRSYDRLTRLPKALVEETARSTSLAQQHWVEARRAGDFGRFSPWLETIVRLKRREAECLSRSGGPLYDALLDDYEPGATSASLAPLFAELEARLTPLVREIMGAPRRPDVSILSGVFPMDRQRVLGEMVAAAIGFDFKSGRLDATAHPFCTGIGPGDCRITTRYKESEFGESFFGVLHEAGHGLYEQGLDAAHHGTPMGEAVSLGIHESQSRLWENLVGRGREFWDHWFPIVRGVFHESLGDVKPERFYEAINAVSPSLIRTQADEATYNFHIIIRFEIESALISGDLAVEGLPVAWNERYGALLGVSPANDAEGCLQDIHWSAGLFGYFPTYTLGNVYSSQIYAAAERELGDLGASFGRGEYLPLREWLRERIHRQGQRHRASALIERVAGGLPSPALFVEQLRDRLAPIYGI